MEHADAIELSFFFYERNKVLRLRVPPECNRYGLRGWQHVENEISGLQSRACQMCHPNKLQDEQK